MTLLSQADIEREGIKGPIVSHAGALPLPLHRGDGELTSRLVVKATATSSASSRSSLLFSKLTLWFHSALLLFRTDEELKKVERLVHNMVERAQRMDGTATGEHGVGIGKKVRVDAEQALG